MTKKFNQKILLYKLQTKRDPDAFAELYDYYVKQIYRFIYFKVSNHEEAEDITSDVFLKAWNYINQGNKIESFRGLLYRMARNSIIDFYRNKSKGQTLDLEKIDQAGLLRADNLEKQIAFNSDKQILFEALQKLKTEYKEIVTLRYVEELKISEIAQITGKRRVATRVTLHRAIKKLKEMLDDSIELTI